MRLRHMAAFLEFEFLSFEFVSDFEIRISDLPIFILSHSRWG
jgi:hypothetical protein